LNSNINIVFFAKKTVVFINFYSKSYIAIKALCGLFLFIFFQILQVITKFNIMRLRCLFVILLLLAFLPNGNITFWIKCDEATEQSSYNLWPSGW